jgi:hypothetical protein
MDQLDRYREIVERVVRQYAAHPPSHGQIELTPIADHEQDDYLLMAVGWGATGRRVHSLLGHVRLRNGKVRVEKDGTEQGLAVELHEAGIPQEDIELAFCQPEQHERIELAAV